MSKQYAPKPLKSNDSRAPSPIVKPLTDAMAEGRHTMSECLHSSCHQTARCTRLSKSRAKWFDRHDDVNRPFAPSFAMGNPRLAPADELGLRGAM
jgi:hypothetical protein